MTGTKRRNSEPPCRIDVGRAGDANGPISLSRVPASLAPPNQFPDFQIESGLVQSRVEAFAIASALTSAPAACAIAGPGCRPAWSCSTAAGPRAASFSCCRRGAARPETCSCACCAEAASFHPASCSPRIPVPRSNDAPPRRVPQLHGLGERLPVAPDECSAGSRGRSGCRWRCSELVSSSGPAGRVPVLHPGRDGCMAPRGSRHRGGSRPLIGWRQRWAGA